VTTRTIVTFDFRRELEKEVYEAKDLSGVPYSLAAMDVPSYLHRFGLGVA
jgi:hypothetical protein